MKFKYFKSNEFKCKCCGVNATSKELVKMLDMAREIANTPFIITSASRCVSHNKKVKGSHTSSHLFNFDKSIESKAVDIKNDNTIILELFKIFKVPNSSKERIKFLLNLKNIYFIYGEPKDSYFYKDKNLTLILSLLKVGFNRVGISKNFIHIDIDKSKSKNVCWVY